MCPRGRPRGQGRPRGLHLCHLHPSGVANSSGLFASRNCCLSIIFAEKLSALTLTSLCSRYEEWTLQDCRAVSY